VRTTTPEVESCDFRLTSIKNASELDETTNPYENENETMIPWVFEPLEN
jgi:hypothetical protein